MTPEISSPLQRQQNWWDDWYKVDFSWAALAKHRKDEETLQDYWRKDPTKSSALTDQELLAKGELQKDPLGRLWHIAHVPLAWSNGTPTWKSDPSHQNWSRFWQSLKA